MKFSILVVVAVLATSAHAQDAKMMLEQDAGRLAHMWDGTYDNANKSTSKSA